MDDYLRFHQDAAADPDMAEEVTASFMHRTSAKAPSPPNGPIYPTTNSPKADWLARMILQPQSSAIYCCNERPSSAPGAHIQLPRGLY